MAAPSNSRVMVQHGRTVVPILGVGAVLVSVLGILSALALAPWFSVLENALSDLGRPGRTSAPIFNAALVVSGLLGIGFVGGLWRESATGIIRLGIAMVGAATAFVVLIGAFPTPHPYHSIVSVGFYLTLTFALFVLGTGDVLAGRGRVGLMAICLGIVHSTAWVVWWVLFDDQWIVGPEAIGASIFATWVCGLVWRSSRLSSEFHP